MMDVSKGVLGLVAAAIAVAAGMLIAGCGGSGGDETMTKAEFAKKAGAICKEAEVRRAKIIAEVMETSDPKGNVEAQQEQLIRKALPTYEEAAQQIDDLGAPEGEEQKVDALVGAMEEAAEMAQADPHTAITSNIFFRKADQFAKSYKLTGCII